MTKFEKDALITLLSMCRKDIENDKITYTGEFTLPIEHKQSAIDAVKQLTALLSCSDD